MAACPVSRPAASPASFFAQGISTFMRCFKEPAAKKFTEHLKSNPTHFGSLMWRGISYSILGKIAQAISDFDQAEVYGNPCEKLVVKGLRLQCRSQPKEATAQFERATQDYPQYPIGWHFYGVDRYYHELLDDITISALKKAISLKFEQAGLTYFFLGTLLASKGQHAEAIVNLKAGIALSPTCTIEYIALGDSLLCTACVDEAKQCYLKAAELNETLVESNRKLAFIYLLEENYEAAAVQAATYLERSPPESHRSDASQADRKKAAGGSGNGGNGSSSDSSDDESDHEWEVRKAENLRKLKKQAIKKAKHNGIYYFLTKLKIGGKDKLVWISADKCRKGHGGSAFKVWLDKRKTIKFHSSFDEKLQEMIGKHESNARRVINKSDMHFLDK